MLNKRLWTVMALFGVGVYLFWGLDSSAWLYILSRRVTRVIAVIFVSFLLNGSTAYFQIITGNRIVSPSLLGMDRLYILVQTLIVFVSQSVLSPTLNFVLTFVVMLSLSILIYGYILKRSNHNMYILLLCGIVLGTLLSSINATVSMMMDPNTYMILQGQSIASLSNVNTSVLLMSSALMIPMVCVYHILNRQVDIVALGDSMAQNLGINLPLFKRQSLVLIAGMAALATAIMGPMLFLGILCVNLAREHISTYKTNTVVLFGTTISVALMMWAQIIFERVFVFNGSISAVVNIIGGLFFVHLVLKERGSYD